MEVVEAVKPRLPWPVSTLYSLNIYCVQVVVGRVDLSSVVLNKVKIQNVQLSSGENISADLVIRNIFNNCF